MSRLNSAGSGRPQGRSKASSPTDRTPRTKDRWSSKRRAAARSAAPSSTDDRRQGDRNTRSNGFDRSDRNTRSNGFERSDRPARRDDRPRSDRPRSDRPRDDRPRNDRRNDHWNNDRQSDRSRDDRPRYDRRSDDRPRYDRRDDRPRYDRSDDRPRNDRPRYDRAERRESTSQPEFVVHERFETEATTEAVTEDGATSFADLGLDSRLVEALAGLGAATPFPIQSASIPAALAGGDVLGRGRTGSGKTIAFGAPMTQRIAESHRSGGKAKRPAYGRRPRGLILAPTRELAMQINKTMEALARSQRLFTTTVVGGVPQQRQVQNLRRGVDIVIGTPGRLEDLINQGKLDLSEVMITVLDEADHMCDLGFLEPVQRLLAQTQPGGQRLLYSATLDKAVESLVNEFLTDPSIHEVAGEDQASGSIDHRLLLVDQREKVQILRELAGAGQKTLIFARTKAYAESLSERLADSGLSVTSLHGDLTQAKRSRNLQLLTSGKVSVLVATDVAARGIHVDDIGLVIQADPPNDHKTYLHRSGRTGRAGREGTVVTLSTRQKRRSVENLLRNAEITAQPTSVRPGDHLLAELAGA